jgi:hypothetical protein
MRHDSRFHAAACVITLLGAASACHDDTASGGGSATTDPTAPGAAPGGTAAPNASPETSHGEVDVPSEPEAVPYVHFDVNHVLSTGQSNSVANDAIPILSTTQPYSNVMFDVGVMTGSGCDRDGCTHYDKPSRFVPLVEGDRFFYPVETMSSGLANEAAKLGLEKKHSLLVSLHGRSGNSYGCLRKGSCDWWPSKGYVQPFDEGVMQMKDAKALADAAGKSYVVRAVTAIHGEHDHYAYTSGDSAFPMLGTDGTSTIADYTDGLIEWQRDYEAAAKDVTKQTLPVPLFINQYSHWNDVPTTKIAYMQLAAHVKSKGKVVVVGPTYALPYTSTCLHFTNHGERQLGEYFAKAYARVVLDGLPWEPLRPTSVTRNGNVVTVKFHVPSPPIVFDTTTVDDPGNYGFEWYDASGAPPAITKVEIAGADTVHVTLASAPTGQDQRLRYAYTFRGCYEGHGMAHGNLRDSDTTPSQAGYALPNWSVHFDEPVN